ncbi:MAG: glutamine synthetase [Alphaproteobacteria bacterium]|nr:glutamine synthetase [Alphaproteobacteria bacterium]
MHREKFLGALETGFGLCDVVLGWDVNDQLYDNSTHTGWHTGFPDASVRIIPESGRQIPMEDDCWLFIGEFVDDAAQLCPRNVLKRVLARAAEMGFGTKAGFEYEFFVFHETPESLRAKHHQDLVPVAPGNTGYSMLRQTSLSSFYRDLFELCGAMNMPLEGLHEEMGAGVMEAALIANDALNAADQAALFKTYAKAHAQAHGMMATFMAKWSAQEAGQSGHIHLSLTDSNGMGNAFHDAGADGHINDTMRHFIGGQQALMPEFTALFAPTVNSYRRLVPGLWAPTAASWGVDNRTCALRIIPGNAKSSRVEHRLPGADTNPYLALAAAIASGLHGVENKIDPGDPVTGNAYESALAVDRQLPRVLEDAGQLFAKSKVARDWFGDTFVDHFAASRDWEAREARKHVSDWELSRYFELI